MLSRCLITLLILCGTAILGHSAEPQSIDTLIQQLSSDDFATRQKATVDLDNATKKAPKQHLQTMLEAYVSTEEPETKLRLHGLLFNLYLQTSFPDERGFLGVVHEIVMVPINGEQRPAILVGSVMPNTPAAKAGMLTNDIITKLNDIDFTKMTLEKARDVFSSSIKKVGAYKSIKITFLRAGKLHELEVTLTSYNSRFQDSGEMDEKFQLWIDKQTKKTAP